MKTILAAHTSTAHAFAAKWIQRPSLQPSQTWRESIAPEAPSLTFQRTREQKQ